MDRHATDRSGNGPPGERRLRRAMPLAMAAMVVLVAGGAVFGSMALLAAGWLMATRAATLAIARLGWRAVRRDAGDLRLGGDSSRITDLGFYSAAIVLGVVALALAWESLLHLFEPAALQPMPAIAAAGLGCGLACTAGAVLAGWRPWWRRAAGTAGTAGPPELRLLPPRAILPAPLVMLALAVVEATGHAFIDPALGLGGAALVAAWAVGKLRRAGAGLLDLAPDPRLAALIRGRIETGGDRIADLRLWRLGPGHAAAMLSVISHHPQPPDLYRRRLEGLPGLAHVTIEVQRCH